jgi:hypothetical protein
LRPSGIARFILLIVCVEHTVDLVSFLKVVAPSLSRTFGDELLYLCLRDSEMAIIKIMLSVESIGDTQQEIDIKDLSVHHGNRK